MENDELLFSPEEETATECKPVRDFWKVMVVDDEEGVHLVTKLALEGFEFEGKALEFINAYSAAEAKELIREHPDTAVILLDVVMEEEDSGLKFARYIREELKNRITRIILRTGQPGQAPEKEVIVNYDINDYKTKTELTSQKLFTTMVAALRSYRDLKIIENSRKGLEKIIDASASIFELKSFEKFVEGVLRQLISFLNLEEDSIYVKTSYFAVPGEEGDLYIVAGTGKYSELGRRKLKEVVPEELYSLMAEALKREETVYGDNSCVVYFKGREASPSLIYIEGYKPLEAWKEKLFKIFCNNISIAYDNMVLVEKMIKKELEAEKYRAEKEKLRDTLERYVGSGWIDEMMEKGDLFSTVKRRAAVMFCDIRGFTEITEKLDPEQVVSLLNGFFSRVVDIIFEFGGMLDKFLGDGLLAVFGVPVELPDSEEMAIRAAVKIRDVIGEWNLKRESEGKLPICIGIGIHSGDVIAGNVGSERRLDYTVIGKTVNVASRVESLNREFCSDILITEDVYRKVKDIVVAEEKNPVFVKGVAEPVRTFRVVNLKQPERCEGV